MLLKSMLGKEVLDSNGDLAGKISDIDVDLINGSVKRIFIKSGLSGTSTVKPEDIVTAGDRIIVRHRKADMEKIETFRFLGIRRRLLCNW